MIKSQEYLKNNNYKWQDIANIAFEQGEDIKTIIENMVKRGVLKDINDKEQWSLWIYVEHRKKNADIIEKSEEYLRENSYNWQDIVRLSLKEDLSIRKTINKLIRNKLLPAISSDEAVNICLYILLALLHLEEDIEDSSSNNKYLKKGNLGWNRLIQESVLSNIPATYTNKIDDMSTKTIINNLIEDGILKELDRDEMKYLMDYLDKKLLESMKLTQLV